MKNSNRLFSEFLASEDLDRVNYFSYFATIIRGSSASLLPSDHGLYYPLEFETTSKVISRGELNFFNEVFYKNLDPSRILPESKSYISERAPNLKSALIINLLDNCYGHSFLKLLNLFNISARYGQKFDLWVIAPAAVSHFIPKEHFYVVEVNLGFTDAMKCYSLGSILNSIKSRYLKFDFVTLDTYSSFDDKSAVLKFFPFVPTFQEFEKRYVTFYYRSDYFRTWGGNSQGKNVSVFFSGLRKYFSKETQFVVVGDKDNYVFPEFINDERTNSFGSDVDFKFNRIFLESHIVLGVIGSNMLQPSMLCDFTIHLVPRSKVTIVAEEFFNYKDNAIQNWFNNIYLFGNESCSDITPPDLIEKTILLFLTNVAKLYKKEIFFDAYFQSQITQVEFTKKQFSFFNYVEAAKLKTEVTNISFKYNLRRFRFFRILKKLKILK